MFSTEQQWTATLELKKAVINIGHQLFCLRQKILQKDQSSDFLIFCYKFPWGIIFGGLCLKNAFDQEKAKKYISFVGKERKEIFSWESKRCSKKMLVGRVVTRKIIEEFTFVNRTAV